MIRPRRDFGVGLAMAGRQARPTNRDAAGVRNRVTSPISVTKIAAHGRTDPVDRLDRLIAAIVAQRAVDLAFEHRDFPVIDLDQIAQRLDPHA